MFLRRLVWAVKAPLLCLLGFPFLPAHLLWCAVAWLLFGRDEFLEDRTPMGWITTGWRYKLATWPLKRNQLP